MSKLTEDDIATMQLAIDIEATNWYYNLVAWNGDDYGRLAQAVVMNNTFAGKIANAFAWSVTNSVNPTLANSDWNATWEKVSIELAQADFKMRLDKYNAGASDHSLSFEEIQFYHNQVFLRNGLPAEAWTAEIILNNHPNPEQWWQNQLSQNGIDNLSAYKNIFNEMVTLSGTEADAHRQEWYNADGTINDGTANSSAWMIANMPVTFWSQHIYSPTGIGAAASGFLESLASGVLEALFEARFFLNFLSDATKNANDILGNYISEAGVFFGYLVNEHMDTAVLNNSTVSGFGSTHEMRLPNDGNIGLWINLTREYQSFSSKFKEFMAEIKIQSADNNIYIEYSKDFSNNGPVVVYQNINFSDLTQDMIQDAVRYFLNFYDPVVLDLDGDGIETIALSDSSSSFLNPDGSTHGWLSADDAFLFIDKNGDGLATNGSELFGSASERGFDALKRLDANDDSVLDQSDPMFSSLRIWRDLDGNGVSSLDEVYTLDQLNIKSFNLAYVNEPFIDNGNIVTDLSSYEMTDGSRRVMADVWFAAA